MLDADQRQVEVGVGADDEAGHLLPDVEFDRHLLQAADDVAGGRQDAGRDEKRRARAVGSADDVGDVIGDVDAAGRRADGCHLLRLGRADRSGRKLRRQQRCQALARLDVVGIGGERFTVEGALLLGIGLGLCQPEVGDCPHFGREFAALKGDADQPCAFGGAVVLHRSDPHFQRSM